VVDCREALFYFCPEIDQPMKTLRLFFFFGAVVFCRQSLQAQILSPSETAIIYADSFLNSFKNNDIGQYADLSYPGVIIYYGGNKNFREYVQRARTLIKAGTSESLMLVQFVHDVAELQCVIKKTSETTIDGRRAQIISYMVGQSKDNGQSWRFIDLAQNSPGNLVYIMPDISPELTVPQRQVIFSTET
jgi:hypothetical protein